MNKVYKVKLLNAGGFDGLDECIGKTFNATKQGQLFRIKCADLVHAGAEYDAVGLEGTFGFWEEIEVIEVDENKFKVGDKVQLVDHIGKLRGKSNFYGISDDIFKYVGRTFTIANVDYDEDENYYEENGGGSVQFFEDKCGYHFPMSYLEKVKKLAGTILSQKIDGDIMTLTIQL